MKALTIGCFSLAITAVLLSACAVFYIHMETVAELNIKTRLLTEEKRLHKEAAAELQEIRAGLANGWAVRF